MERSQKSIMVIKKEILFNDNYFEGFRTVKGVDYQLRILENYEWMERVIAENNPSYKQPIVYMIIINPSLKQIFVYQRSFQEAVYSEKRLQGKLSLGLGGHIERVDFETGCKNPILASGLRELKEEVEIKGSTNPRMLGYINNDSDNVGKVHFGILYILETNARIVKPKDPEIESGGLRTIKELEKIYSSSGFTVEEWSRISFEPVKNYLR